MTKAELKLASYLLDLAGDEFGNHGCNDFMERDYEEAKLNKCDVLEITASINEWDTPADPEENLTPYYIPDWLLFRYLADKLKDEAEKP